MDDETIPSQQDDNKENTTQDYYVIDPELLRLLQREVDLETVDNEPDPQVGLCFVECVIYSNIQRNEQIISTFIPQKRMVYEEVYTKSIINRRSSAVDDEIKSLRRELRLNSIITNTESLFTLPRTFTRRSARFELPMSKNSLCGKLIRLITHFLLIRRMNNNECEKNVFSRYDIVKLLEITRLYYKQ